MTGRSATFDHIAGRIPASAFAADEPPVQALVIACVEGCAPPGRLEGHLRMTGVSVTRNPANLVPPCGSEGLAVTVGRALARGAQELIVFGHVGCATIARLLDPATAWNDLELSAWLDHAEPVRLAMRGLPAAERLARAVEWNITQQLAHLRVYPAVAAALLNGQLSLRGWLLDPHRDEVLALDPHTDRFTRRAALDPAQNSLFLAERLRAGPPSALPRRDLTSRHLA